MSDLRQNLIREFQDPDYRYGYAESFLNTKIAAQIRTLRESRGKKQAELGVLIGTKQSGFSRFEDVNHSVWKTDTLWKIARALDVRLNISFETFGSLLDEKERFSKGSLELPNFKNDPAFQQSAIMPKEGSRNLLDVVMADNPGLAATLSGAVGSLTALQKSSLNAVAYRNQLGTQISKAANTANAVVSNLTSNPRLTADRVQAQLAENANPGIDKSKVRSITSGKPWPHSKRTHDPSERRVRRLA